MLNNNLILLILTAVVLVNIYVETLTHFLGFLVEFKV